MNREQYTKLVYPTIGRINCPKELEQTIKNIVGKSWVTSQRNHNGAREFEPKTVKPKIFYCYVSEQVYLEWRTKNYSDDQYDVQFTLENPGIYKVTLA